MMEVIVSALALFSCTINHHYGLIRRVSIVDVERFSSSETVRIRIHPHLALFRAIHRTCGFHRGSRSIVRARSGERPGVHVSPCSRITSAVALVPVRRAGRLHVLCVRRGRAGRRSRCEDPVLLGDHLDVAIDYLQKRGSGPYDGIRSHGLAKRCPTVGNRYPLTLVLLRGTTSGDSSLF